MHWHTRYHIEGTGHLYQDRYKTFPIEEDEYLLTVLRYVERNALRANLCERAEGWKYSSLWRRICGDKESQKLFRVWPFARPQAGKALVNRTQTETEKKTIRICLKKGKPYGNELLCRNGSLNGRRAC